MHLSLYMIVCACSILLRYDSTKCTTITTISPTNTTNTTATAIIFDTNNNNTTTTLTRFSSDDQSIFSNTDSFTEAAIVPTNTCAFVIQKLVAPNTFFYPHQHLTTNYSTPDDLKDLWIIDCLFLLIQNRQYVPIGINPFNTLRLHLTTICQKNPIPTTPP